MEAEISLIKITRDCMRSRIVDFLFLEDNWTEIGEKAWEESNFFCELPLKWELSVGAEKEGSLVGYLIGSEQIPSEYGERASRVNKIVVDKLCRGKGIARKLLKSYFENCMELGINLFEIKALNENAAANNLYRSLGYIKTGEVLGSDNKMRTAYLRWS